MDLTLPIKAGATNRYNQEHLFNPTMLALVLAGLKLLNAPTTDVEHYFETQKPAADGLSEAVKKAPDFVESQLFWSTAKKTFSSKDLQLSAFKIWLFASLKKDITPDVVRRFFNRLRAEWHLDWCTVLTVTDAFLRGGKQPDLDPVILEEEDRKIVVALVSLLAHADTNLHAREVKLFRKTIEILGFEPTNIGFLHNFASLDVTALAKMLGPQKIKAALLYIVRMTVADEEVRPSELTTLEAAIAAVGLDPMSLDVVTKLIAIETGATVNFH
jgi:uncharacterized tellurite resistance protein B-like protein